MESSTILVVYDGQSKSFCYFIVTLFYHNTVTHLFNHLQSRLPQSTPDPAAPPFLERTILLLFWDLLNSSRHIGFEFDVFYGAKTVTFEAHFDLGEKLEICWY